MLALDSPLGVVADLALYRDHAIANRIHYVPTRPRVARSEEDASEGDSSVSFIKVRGAADDEGAGLLLLTTELTASEEQLERARTHLASVGVDNPELQQVGFRAGKAVLVAALSEGDGFVEKIFGEVTPDLLGRNRAVFSLQLNERGAELIEAMLKPESPSVLGVRYELEFLGLRPALAARLRADYSRIHDELASSLEVGVAHSELGVRAGVDSALKKLREDGAIEVEILRFNDDAELRDRIDRTLGWFQDKLIGDLFRTQLGSPTLGETPSVASEEEDASRAPTVTAELSLREVQREELGTMEIDWSEAHAEVRSIAAQALLADLGARARIVEVDLEDDLWKRLDVEVRPLVDLEGLGIDRLMVTVAYPDEERPDATRETFVFEPGQTDARHFSAWTEGESRRYRTRTEVLFASGGPWPGPARFASAWRETDAFELVVHPLTGVPRLELELARGSIAFEETPKVQVEVRVDGEVVANEMLSEGSPSVRIQRRLIEAEDPLAPSRPLVEARSTWFHAEGERSEGEWAAVEGDLVLVQSPWRSHRTIRAFPMLPPDFIDASVNFTMLDGDARREASIQFSPGERGTKLVRLPSLAEVPPPVEVEVLVVHRDGTSFMGTPFETRDPVVLVRDREGEHRKVSVRVLAGPSFAAHGVIAVQVQLLDPSDAVLDSLVFTDSQREPGVLFVPLVEGSDAPLRYRPLRYRVVRFGLDGLPQPGELVLESSGRLLIPASVSPRD